MLRCVHHRWGHAAVLYVRRDFEALVNGIANGASLIRSMHQNEIFGVEVLATVGAVVSLGGQLRGIWVILFLCKTATPGVFFESPGDPSVDWEFSGDCSATSGIMLGGRSSAVRETCRCAQ